MARTNIKKRFELLRSARSFEERAAIWLADDPQKESNMGERERRTEAEIDAGVVELMNRVLSQQLFYDRETLYVARWFLYKVGGDVPLGAEWGKKCRAWLRLQSAGDYRHAFYPSELERVLAGRAADIKQYRKIAGLMGITVAKLFADPPLAGAEVAKKQKQENQDRFDDLEKRVAALEKKASEPMRFVAVQGE